MEICKIAQQSVALHLGSSVGENSRRTRRTGSVNAVIPKEFLQLLSSASGIPELEETVSEDTAVLYLGLVARPSRGNHATTTLRFYVHDNNSVCCPRFSHLAELVGGRSNRLSCDLRLKLSSKAVDNFQNDLLFEMNNNNIILDNAPQARLTGKSGSIDSTTFYDNWKNPQVEFCAEFMMTARMDWSLAILAARNLETSIWKQAVQRMVQRIEATGNDSGDAAANPGGSVGPLELLHLNQMMEQLSNLVHGFE